MYHCELCGVQQFICDERKRLSSGLARLDGAAVGVVQKKQALQEQIVKRARRLR